MSVIDLLLDLFRSEESQQELANDPSAFLAENVPEGLTAEQVLERAEVLEGDPDDEG